MEFLIKMGNRCVKVCACEGGGVCEGEVGIVIL